MEELREIIMNRDALLETAAKSIELLVNSTDVVEVFSVYDLICFRI